jgi:hypothetical protein
MSIGPVQSYGSIVDAASASGQTPEPQPRRQAQRRVDPPQTFLPGAGYGPKQEAPVQKDVSPASQLPEDEVQLQRDSGLQNELIVRYVDKTGNLILQVPAEQLLHFERAIAAEFQQAKPPATTEGENPKGGSHGH